MSNYWWRCSNCSKQNLMRLDNCVHCLTPRSQGGDIEKVLRSPAREKAIQKERGKYKKPGPLTSSERKGLPIAQVSTCEESLRAGGLTIGQTIAITHVKREREIYEPILVQYRRKFK